MLIELEENGIHLVADPSKVSGSMLLFHLSTHPFDQGIIPDDLKNHTRYTMVEVRRSGVDQVGHMGGRHVCCNPGGSAGVPVYITHRDLRNKQGRRLEFVQAADDLLITSVYQFYDGIPVIRAETILENTGNHPIPIEYVSSFALTGLTKEESSPWDACAKIHLPFNAWMDEHQWRAFTLPELGMCHNRPAGFSTQRLAFSNTGSYAAKEMLPLGCFENTISGRTYAWQIECHGSWTWEITDQAAQLCLRVSGPCELENQWFKMLHPGEVFNSIPAAVAIVEGKPEVAFEALNRYRRAIRRDNDDNRKLPIIFNDYMNCLNADPTTEKLLPLIEQAASLGAEYYVIDAGWYADGPWWDSVGEWLPSKQRFPNGINEVIKHIVAHGMKPGIWLELERMGKNCRLATEWPDDCFFCRHGLRTIENNSLHLDFRHPIVRRHADAVIDRVIGEMGVGFIKMDYNFDIGPGTEIDADSFGDGMLQHQRAYLQWLDDLFLRYPDLVIENCASGGMRNTYSLLSRLSICSTTDNTDYLANARISINSAAAFCPEQAGVWSYPLATASNEEIIMNMVSCLLWRPYLSGQIWALDETKMDLIREGVSLYREKLRQFIRHAHPFWPLGLSMPGQKWGSFGLRNGRKVLLAVWHFAEEEIGLIDIPFQPMSIQKIRCIYPAKDSFTASVVSADCHNAQLCLGPKSARLFEIDL